MQQRDPRKPGQHKDTNPNGEVGERVFFHSPATRPRAAMIGNVDETGGPVDLVVFCQGRSIESRERWAQGWGVVGFRGLIPHVSQAGLLKSPNWWSRVAADCEDGIVYVPPTQAEAPR